MDNVFITTFREKFRKLGNHALKNKCKVLVPSKKFITPNMLNANFYENHIFYISKYDENLYINLQGKVLSFSNPTFTAFIGWKEQDGKMTLNVKDSFFSQEGLEFLNIDNVCDIVSYTTQSTNKTEKVKKCSNGEEYISFYTEEFNKHIEDFTKLKDNISRFQNIMMNNLIFLKGYEESYAKEFQERVKKICDETRNLLQKIKISDESLNTVVSELTDSMVFREKMYYFIFEHLKDFHKEEQERLSAKLKEVSLANQLKDDYKECKFLKPILLLKELSKKHTFFEKQNVICQIMKEINEEAKKCFDNKYNFKNKYNPDADEYSNFYEYILVRADTDDLIAEKAFLQYFNAFSTQSMAGGSYMLTTFIVNVEALVNKYLNSEEEKRNVRGIQQSFIKTQEIS